MKKYLFMALLASLVILSGCKKKTENIETKTDDKETVTEKRPTLTKIYTDCIKLIDTDSAVAVQAILADGWKRFDSDDWEESFIKVLVAGSDTMQLFVEYSPTSSKVIHAGCSFCNISGDENLTQADWKALIQNIGEKPTVAGVEVPFKELAYGESFDKVETKATTYQAAIDALPDAFAAESFEYNWEATSYYISLGKLSNGKPKAYHIYACRIQPQ